MKSTCSRGTQYIAMGAYRSVFALEAALLVDFVGLRDDVEILVGCHVYNIIGYDARAPVGAAVRRLDEAVLDARIDRQQPSAVLGPSGVDQFYAAVVRGVRRARRTARC